MSREGSLVKNTLVLSIGTVFPKLASFVVLPILTGCLTKSEYGTYDLITVLCSLFLPAVTLQIQTAAFRVLIEKKTAVGDKYVYEYMAKNGCRIGGEQSGHIIFSKYASTGDGILTSLKMMEVMLAKKKPMSELAAPLKIYPQVLENVRVTDKKAAQNDPDE